MHPDAGGEGNRWLDHYTYRHEQEDMSAFAAAVTALFDPIVYRGKDL